MKSHLPWVFTASGKYSSTTLSIMPSLFTRCCSLYFLPTVLLNWWMQYTIFCLVLIFSSFAAPLQMLYGLSHGLHCWPNNCLLLYRITRKEAWCAYSSFLGPPQIWFSLCFFHRLLHCFAGQILWKFFLGLAQALEIDHSSCHAGETNPENLLRNFVCYQLGVCNQKSIRQLLWIFSQDGQYYWEDEI